MMISSWHFTTLRQMSGSPCLGGPARECHRIETWLDCGHVTIMWRHLNRWLGASLGLIGSETAKISRFFVDKPREGICGLRPKPACLRGGIFLFLEKKLFSRPGFENID